MVRVIFLILLAVLGATGIAIGTWALFSNGAGLDPLIDTALGLGAVLGFLTVLFAIPLLIAIPSVRQHRHIRIVAYLAQAVKLNLPLPQIIKAAARSESGAMQKALLELERNVASGASLGTCLRAALPRMPRRDVQIVEAGEQMGRLVPALEAVSKEGLARHRRHDAGAVEASYLMVIMTLAVTGLVVVGVSIFILPKFERIFEDYGITLPPWTVSVMESRELIWLAMAALLVVMLVMLVREFAKLFIEPRPMATRWRTALLHVLWYTPARGAMRDKAMADACFLLSQGTAAGMAMPDALELAGQALGDHPFSSRLYRWSGSMRSGEPVQDAARKAGMPDLVCGMVGSARGQDGMEAVMTFLQRYYAGKFSRLEMMMRAAGEPLMTLGAAILVGWVVIGMFLPLVKLIRVCVMETGMF